MDSVSVPVIDFELDDFAKAEFAEDWQLELNITGDVTISISGRLLFHEVSFCLFELAMQAQRWLHHVRTENEDFHYVSMESQERWLVWVERGATGWKIGSVFQEYEETTEFALEDILDCFQSFIETLQVDLLEKHGLDVRDVIKNAETTYKGIDVRQDRIRQS